MAPTHSLSLGVAEGYADVAKRQTPDLEEVVLVKQRGGSNPLIRTIL